MRFLLSLFFIPMASVAAQLVPGTYLMAKTQWPSTAPHAEPCDVVSELNVLDGNRVQFADRFYGACPDLPAPEVNLRTYALEPTFEFVCGNTFEAPAAEGKVSPLILNDYRTGPRRCFHPLPGDPPAIRTDIHLQEIGDEVVNWSALTCAQCEQVKRTKAESFCRPDSTGNFVAAPLQLAEKGTNAQGRLYALGGGCVLKSLADVWKASQKTSFFAWDKSNLDSVGKISHPGSELAFAAQHSAGPALFQVHWTIDWYHRLLAGSLAAPETVEIQFAKVRGTNHIRYWAGNLTLQAVTPTVTAVSIRNEISADQTSLADCTGGVGDLLAKLRK